MTNNRYVELKFLEAIEYAKYSKAMNWSFTIRVDDKNICFIGDLSNLNDKNSIIAKFTEVLNVMEFCVDEQHLRELIDDLKKVRLYKFRLCFRIV